MAELQLAVAQFAPGSDTEANLAAIRSLARAAVARGARLVVFPEYSSFFVNPVGAPFLDAAETLDGTFVTALGALADELDATIVAGMAERSEQPGRFSNTVVALAPGSGLVASYRKQHLYDAFGARESEWVAPGGLEEPQLFDVDGVRIGLQTCYDLRFPEVTRRIVDAGAELVLVPSEWVRGTLKEHHWRTLITARAIENTVYVAAADHVPPVGVGASLIVDPVGVTLAELGDETDAALASLSTQRLHEVRQMNPALELRRYTVVPKAAS
ncbi:carbon-nitrogen hydrolase family protein [Gryllotalpicola ginsengisoli]|uniref:carbon-nitrogen hydrolase family protein n=1 Tax=Gryllotalpicola ginsengisoli TaxID=444608 RepID=UPI0003B78207|nr:carbon-nitrogen hydrolase family protein [Gryllotalpicola ginsengisoli]